MAQRWHALLSFFNRTSFICRCHEILTRGNAFLVLGTSWKKVLHIKKEYHNKKEKYYKRNSEIKKRFAYYLYRSHEILSSGNKLVISRKRDIKSLVSLGNSITREVQLEKKISDCYFQSLKLDHQKLDW